MLDLDEGDALLIKQNELESCIFDNSLALKRVVSEIVKSECTHPSGMLSVKLPKIDVPTFNGDVTGWRTFWEQLLCILILTYPSQRR